MSTEVETSQDFSERAECVDVLLRRRDQRFLDFARNDNFRRSLYNFQAVFPPTIVRTARPFNFQPLKGELRETD
jgi:hypothetical protein